VITKKQFADEFCELADQAGIEDTCAIEFTSEVRTSPRSYAAVEPHDLHFYFAPETLELPWEHRRGLIMHELGHVLCKDMPRGGTEDDADRAALECFGEKIVYDKNWPGKGLQCVLPSHRRKNPADRLREELAKKPLRHQQRVDFVPYRDGSLQGSVMVPDAPSWFSARYVLLPDDAERDFWRAPPGAVILVTWETWDPEKGGEIRGREFFDSIDELRGAIPRLVIGGGASLSPSEDLKLWRLGIKGWSAVRSVTPETADQWLAVWQESEPKSEFVIAKKKPRAKKGYLQKFPDATRRNPSSHVTFVPSDWVVEGLVQGEVTVDGVPEYLLDMTFTRLMDDEQRDFWRAPPWATILLTWETPKQIRAESAFFDSEDSARHFIETELIPKTRKNPPYSGYDPRYPTRKMPKDPTKISYKTKRDALNVFIDWNSSIIDEAFSGPSARQPYDSFDNINHRFGLTGSRRVDTFAKALWWAMPAGSPFYLEDIDVEMLNATSPMIHNTDRRLTLPDYAEEQRLLEKQRDYYESRYYADEEEVPF